jgi:hypothetical protein
MTSSFNDFDDFDSDLLQANTPAIQKVKAGSIKQENYIVGLIGVALVLASAWLPWMVVRLPGSSVTHLYDFTTGGGATTFYFLVALPILGGGIAWAAKQRAGLVVAAVSSMGLGVLALIVIAALSTVSSFIPNIGILGSEIATGRLSPGAGASICLIGCLLMGMVAIVEFGEMRGVGITLDIPFQQVFLLGGLIVGEVASHVPWTSIRITSGGPTVEVSGDGLIGSFFVQLLGWAAILIWMLSFLVSHKAVRGIALIVTSLVATARLAYAVLLWVSSAAAQSLVPDSVGNAINTTIEPGMIVTILLSLLVFVFVVLELVKKNSSTN